MIRSRYTLTLLFLSLIFFLVFAWNLFTGEYSFSWSDLLHDSSMAQMIFFKFRLPKALAAIAVGTALSLSGLLMQTLFKNPIAGPYILGISSGASLGVAIFTMGAGFFASSIFFYFSQVLGALLGSLFMMLLLLFLLQYLKNIITLLIVGVMLSALAASLISILQYFSSDYLLKSFVIWTMGSLSQVSYTNLTIMGLAISLAILLYVVNIKNINILILGTEEIKNYGVHKRKLQWTILIITSILTSVVTAFCGPIGFIGIIVPHFAKMLTKTSDHLYLIPISILLGSILMLFSDIITQIPPNGMILPINSVTAILGIPFILWILLKSAKNNF